MNGVNSLDGLIRACDLIIFRCFLYTNVNKCKEIRLMDLS